MRPFWTCLRFISLNLSPRLSVFVAKFSPFFHLVVARFPIFPHSTGLLVLRISATFASQDDAHSKASYAWGRSAPGAFERVGGAAFSYPSAVCYLFGRQVRLRDDGTALNIFAAACVTHLLHNAL
eukprot:6172698-Pleurochrysis_carterae.AAC.2